MTKNKEISDKNYCRWSPPSNFEIDYWETECDNAFNLIDGTPSENGMKFCPYCGKKLIEIKEDEK